MLVFGRRQFTAHFRWFLASVFLTAGMIVSYTLTAVQTGELPGGSSPLGLMLGIVGAGIIAFEMLLWPRKRFLRARTLPLIRTKQWMKAHIWLGLLAVPIAVLHSGFRCGGPLATTLMLMLGIVIASGIVGLVLQAWIPRRMLELVPEEVPITETERILAVHLAEFERRLAIAQGKLGGPEIEGIDEVVRYYHSEAKPYILGITFPESLTSPTRATSTFALLQARIPAASHPRLQELFKLCDLRRQFHIQTRLHWWLYHWLWIHLPLSVALVGLLIAHIYVALRYI